MATVPSYEPNRIESQPARLPRRQNPIDGDVLAAPGLALAQAGNVLGQIAINEQRKAEDTQVLGGNRGLGQAEVDLMYNPQTGAMTKKGREAIGLSDKVLPEFDKRRAALEAGMNPGAKRRFAALADQRRQDIEKQLFALEARESDSLNLAETEANVAQAKNEAAIHYKNPERIQTSTELGWAAMYARMAREGDPPEKIAVKRRQWEAEIKGTILDQMIANRENADAIAFYDVNRAALGDKADEYGMKIREARYEVESVATSDRLLRQYGGPTPAAYAEAAQIKDPEIRKRTESDLDAVGIREQRAIQQNEQNVRRGAWARLANAPAGSRFDDVFDVNERVGIDSVEGLRASLQRELDAKLQATEVRTDPVVYRKLIDMGDKLATYDATKEFGSLSPSDRVFIENRQKDMQNPAKKAQFATEDQQLDIVYADLGIPSGTKGAAKRAEFDKAYREDLRTWIANNKREPTAEERQKIMDGLTLPFVRKGRFFGEDKVPAYKLDPADPKSMERVTIPDDARAQIIARRAASGKPPLTEEQLMRVYIQWKGGQ